MSLDRPGKADYARTLAYLDGLRAANLVAEQRPAVLIERFTVLRLARLASPDEALALVDALQGTAGTEAGVASPALSEAAQVLAAAGQGPAADRAWRSVLALGLHLGAGEAEDRQRHYDAYLAAVAGLYDLYARRGEPDLLATVPCAAECDAGLHDVVVACLTRAVPGDPARLRRAATAFYRVRLQAGSAWAALQLGWLGDPADLPLLSLPPARELSPPSLLAGARLVARIRLGDAAALGLATASLTSPRPDLQDTAIEILVRARTGASLQAAMVAFDQLAPRRLEEVVEIGGQRQTMLTEMPSLAETCIAQLTRIAGDLPLPAERTLPPAAGAWRSWVEANRERLCAVDPFRRGGGP